MKKLPNIIFIVMDTMAAKHMSLYGYGRQTTPNLERIAQECTVYERCFAPACWTVPSHASMFTGLYPSQHGAYEGRFFLSDNIQHLVSALKMSGYRTVGISANGLVSPASGLCREFDYFKDFGAEVFQRFLNIFHVKTPQQEGEELKNLEGRLAKGLSIKEKIKILIDYVQETGEWKKAIQGIIRSAKGRLDRILRPTPIVNSSIYTEKTIKIFRDLIERYSGKNQPPFFLFINFLETHESYRPPLKYRKFSRWHDRQLFPMVQFYHSLENPELKTVLDIYRNLYDDEIFYLDNNVNILWNILKNSPAAQETVFIITSDHGEHFGEKSLYQHELSLYNELIWVPLIIKFPPDIVSNGMSDRLVSLNDLYGTILDLANNPLPHPETSFSLLSSSTRDIALAQYVYPEINRGHLEALQEFVKKEGREFSPAILAIITKSGRKIIENRDGTLEIFDLNNDINENQNLINGISKESLKNIREMIDIIKKETGYNEAVGDVRNTTNLSKFNGIIF